MDIQTQSTPPTSSEVLTSLNLLASKHGKIDKLSFSPDAQHKRVMHNLLLSMLIEHEGDSTLGDFLRCYRTADLSYSFNVKEHTIEDAESAAYEITDLADLIMQELISDIPE